MKNKLISNILEFTNHYFGWRNWAVLVYNSIMENMFVIFYILLRQEAYSFKYILNFFNFLLFSSLCTTYGYLINDFGDRELDKLHGKDNTFQNDSNIKSVGVVLLFLFLCIFFGYPYIENRVFVIFFISWFCIATGYSVKPFRFKERGTAGLVLVVIAQRVLPILIVFSAFNYFNLIDCLILTSYIFFRGLSSDVNHQLEDYHKDSKTDTTTYAVQAGYKKTEKILMVSLELEKGFLVLSLLLIMVKLLHLEFMSVPAILPAAGFYIFLYTASFIAMVRPEKKQKRNPFSEGSRNIFHFIHHTFPSVILPLYFLLILTKESYWFLIIIMFIILIRKMYSLELILNSLPVRVVKKGVDKVLFRDPPTE